MFKKILIANRGEIACRVIRTAKRLGIETVAVYSEADQNALHVKAADQSVLIGPPQASQSYLDIQRIIDACHETGAEAVHPGYGFLSENPIFAERLAQEGIVFIGPPAQAIKSMGDKVTSKKIAAEAGVNVIPGSLDIIRDADHAVKVAHEIGYPVMIKASAGGGGKGMRIVYNDSECRDGFIRATAEASSSFANADVFIEKFIESPRHIEMQILADQHGNVVYLGERECSIQRRHQKVIEEAPSPFLDPETRKAMGEQAVALARAVGYVSAGTVEFIVDPHRQFYFLETNTRLQVEHPVTEYVTGLDLVEMMLLIAAGQPLPFKQEEIHHTGWAIESRIYAEDPLRNFLPSTGRLVRYQPPHLDEAVRMDTGVYEGGEVSMFYDPLIAKLVTYGESRSAAIDKMRFALDRFIIRGLQHNIGFLAAVMAHPRFFDGNLSTNFIAEEFPDGFQPIEPTDEELARAIACAAKIHVMRLERDNQLEGKIYGANPKVRRDWIALYNGQKLPFRVEPCSDGRLVQVTMQGKTYTVSGDWRFGNLMFSGQVNGDEVAIHIKRRPLGFRLSWGGSQIEILVLSPRQAELYGIMPIKRAADTSRFLLSPMPGLLVSLSAKPGQMVREGEVLAVIEAMKMQNSILAPHDVIVEAILAEPGDSLVVDQPVIEFRI